MAVKDQLRLCGLIPRRSLTTERLTWLVVRFAQVGSRAT